MRLLTRYLLRQLVAPFVFALMALTGIMLLNQVAKKFGSLVGKGLPWSVIAEVFALSVPFIVAMTLPMAVLVAVLYAFSHLAADNELTAMRASGVSIAQTVMPVLVWGLFMATVNFAFVDQVLPRSNARLRGLLIDIGRKKPSFSLREQVINEIPPSQFFLRAGRIDPANGRLRDITIYDMAGTTTRRIIYADSGAMGYAPGERDLSLRLYHGAIHQFRREEPDLFQLTYFAVNDIRVKNVFDELERNTDDVVRGDRELSTCEMIAVVDSASWQLAQARRERADLLHRDLQTLLGRPPPPPTPMAPKPPAAVEPGYCRLFDRARTALLPSVAHAQGRPPPQAPPRAPPQAPLQARPRTRSPAPPRVQTPIQRRDSANAAAAHTPVDPIALSRLTTWGEAANAADRGREAKRRADRYAVEVHKKWAISAACISFVLVGITMALRFPRGGMGLVIGGGLLVFSIYYVGLTAGESLADRGYVSPVLAMWSPNIILTIAGLTGLFRVSRESGSTRGGDFQEVLDGARALARGLARKLLRRG